MSPVSTLAEVLGCGALAGKVYGAMKPEETQVASFGTGAAPGALVTERTTRFDPLAQMELTRYMVPPTPG